MVSFSDQCEKQAATLPTQVGEGKEKENVSPPSERENSTAKGEFVYHMSLHVHQYICNICLILCVVVQPYVGLDLPHPYILVWLVNGLS